jgi:hypothetical protein
MWIVPLLYLGITDRYAPWTPRPVQNLQNTFQLFVGRMEWWPVVYLEARFGTDEWVTLPEEEYFKMKPFGYRTRMTRFREVFGGQRLLAQDELALWVKKQYEKLHPEDAAMTEFRVVVGRWIVRNEKFSSYWVKPPLQSFAPDQRYVMSSYKFLDQYV